MSADEFESLYLFMFKNDQAAYQEEVYQVLDDLFADVDAYCSDPSLRQPNDLDEHQLLQEARKALHALEQLRGQTGS